MSRVTIGQGDRRALANSIASKLFEKYSILHREDGCDVQDQSVINKIAEAVDDYFGPVKL